LKTVLKVALGVLLGFAVLIGGCVALIGAGVDEADKEQRKKGISVSEFRSMQLGSSQAEVRRRLGKPEDAQQFEQAGIEGLTQPSRSSCVYYPEKGKALFEGRSFQLCFTDGRLDSKNIY
jgi:hypothetical protein